MNMLSLLALAKKYTDGSIAGITGTLAGKNCTVDSITPITGGNRITFKWTADDSTVKTGTMDVMNGAKGDKGDKGDTGLTGEKGDTGAQGVQGIQGVKGDKGDKGDTGNTGAAGANGEKGDAATITIGTVQSGASPAVTNSGTTSNAVFNFTLPKGDKGDKGDKGENGLDGKSFEIKAKYADLASLVAEHPTGTAGEAYLVGDNDNPDLYIWLTEDAEWFNNGKIAGVKGDKGDTGDDGYSPSASVSKSGDTVTITIQDKSGQTTATVRDGQNGSDGTDGKSAYEIAVDEGFVGTESEWLASLVGEKGADGEKGEQGIQGIQGLKGDQGIQGVKGDAGFSPIANVTESDGVYTIHIEDENGTTEEEIDMSGYATKNDIAVRHDYSIAGTTNTIADTKALVNHIITLGVGTYSGEFKRTGITFGSYRLTYLIDGTYSKSVSGLVTYSINANTDATYQVSYVEDIEHGTPPEWKIEKLVTESENNFTYKVLVTDSDLNNVKTSGAYSIYISDATSQATNHAPTYGWLQLVVVQMNNSQSFCNQILYSADGKMFMRECGNNTWTDWRPLTPTNSIARDSTAPVMSGTVYNQFVQKAQTVVNDIVSQSAGAYSSLVRRGNIVQCIARFNTESSFSWSTNTKIGTIPQGYRPAVFQPCPTVNFSGTSPSTTFVSVDTNGDILCIPLTGDRLDLYINLTWYTEDA